jgi:hypothetical protein
MTTVSMGGGLGLQSRQRKRGLNHRLSLLKKTAIILLKSSKRVCCGELWQEILDRERHQFLKRDDGGTSPKTGSISGVRLGLSV